MGRPGLREAAVTDEGFYEDDEPAAKIRAIFEAGRTGYEPDDEWWTTTDVANYLGVKIGTVSSYRGRGQMPAPDRTLGRTHLWRPATIVAWHARRRGVARTPTKGWRQRMSYGGGVVRDRHVDEPRNAWITDSSIAGMRNFYVKLSDRVVAKEVIATHADVELDESGEVIGVTVIFVEG